MTIKTIQKRSSEVALEELRYVLLHLKSARWLLYHYIVYKDTIVGVSLPLFE